MPAILHLDSQTLSVHIRRGVYHTMVLSALLYGSETWVVKSPIVLIRRLESFHNRCVWMILDVSKTKQWKECTTSIRSWLTGLG